MLKRTLYAGIVLACFVPASLSAAEGPTIAIPESLMKTESDRTAWERVEEIVSIADRFYYRKPTGSEIADLFLTRGVSAIDPHTMIFSEAEMRRARQDHDAGKFGGLGMEVQGASDPMLPRGITIVSPLPDQPAEKAGILAKDIITHVDGAPIGDLPLTDAVDLIRGPVGKPVNLRVYRPGTGILPDFRIVREEIEIRFVEHALKEGGFGYVRLKSFGGPAYKQLVQAIEKLQGENGKPLSGLILNLENNPGGLLNVTDAMIDLFLVGSRYSEKNASTTISTESRGAIQAYAHAGGGEDVIGGAPLLILINGGSASASEVLSGVLQMHGRATIAGSDSSFGKGTVQTDFDLRTGGMIRLTTYQYLIGPTGCEKPVQNIGITPDILIRPKADAPDWAAGRREKSMSRTIETLANDRSQCMYHYAVGPQDRAAAYKMLHTIGRKPVEPEPAGVQQ